jgi:hypothetical protein
VRAADLFKIQNINLVQPAGALGSLKKKQNQEKNLSTLPTFVLNFDGKVHKIKLENVTVPLVPVR